MIRDPVDAVVALTGPRSASEYGELVGVLAVLGAWTDIVRTAMDVRLDLIVATGATSR